jgi:hypothetical protein
MTRDATHLAQVTNRSTLLARKLNKEAYKKNHARMLGKKKLKLSQALLM